MHGAGMARQVGAEAAAEVDGLEAMEALLEWGADPNATDAHGNTALAIARARDEDDKFELLLKYHAR